MGSTTPDASDSPAQRLLAQLARHAAPETRYETRGEVARGGMGAILEVWDDDLRRQLAMKVVREREGRALDPSALQRFLEEAQVTAQLSHPGVPPVHELGLDEKGRVFFTMPLIHGRDLAHVFEQVRRGEEGWSTTRALGVLHKVCETMAYAHSRGVIHRDLKPANVMVGEFGEVYVMDWGLAKAVGTAEAEPSSTVSTVREIATEDDPSAALLTLEGAIVGTPSYMSPEQARGEALDARSDVYAIGAMLYALLAGRAPYQPAHASATPVQIVTAIHRGPPPPLAQMTADVPAELVAVCEKAMARERAGRYASTVEMAEDLRAFLEGRVVRAYRTGAWVEFRKWVGRNKGMASSLAVAVLALLAGAAVTALVSADAAKRDREDKRRILGLSDEKVLRDVLAREDELWPAVPALEDAMTAWLDQATALRARLPEHRASLEQLPAAEAASEEQAWQREILERLVAGLEALPEHIEAVEARRAIAAGLAELTRTSPEARERWSTAVDAIREHDAYGGLELAPQLGLLPLGEAPESGLWEFWHVLSGAEPKRDPESGRHVLDEHSGIVLVLLPGGESDMGSSDVEGEPLFDPLRRPGDDDEVLHRGVRLDPFFVSKYETTREQWVRINGSCPSARIMALQPVDSVSLHDVREIARRLALTVPSEARWERACRAGTRTPFSTGPAVSSLQGYANIADATYAEAQGGRQGFESVGIRDGHRYYAPVGSFLPNAFGLYDVHGNVWEWCGDAYIYDDPPRSGDGARGDGRELGSGVIRGGSWFAGGADCRCANRLSHAATGREQDLGVRFARDLD